MDWTLASTVCGFWDWHGYMTKTEVSFYPLKALFNGKYDTMFADQINPRGDTT
jgi:hypothetical protein